MDLRILSGHSYRTASAERENLPHRWRIEIVSPESKVLRPWGGGKRGIAVLKPKDREQTWKEVFYFGHSNS